MDYEELCRTAAEVVSSSEYTQTEIAEELEVTTGAISRALSESGPKLSRLQCRILEYLTSCEIERTATFTAICDDG